MNKHYRISLKYIAMKKSSVKRVAKITIVITSISFLSLLIWANWEPKGYTQIHVADSKFVVYDVSNLNNDVQPVNIEKKISAIEGVSSCSYNSVKKFIGVIFYTSKISSAELQNKISESLGFKAFETKAPEQKNGCPVGGIKYFALHVKHFLNFRS